MVGDLSKSVVALRCVAVCHIALSGVGVVLRFVGLVCGCGCGCVALRWVRLVVCCV